MTHTALEALKRAGTPPQEQAMEHTEAYQILKRAGHSAAKSLEIALDAKRGCKFALHWVKLAGEKR